jgi:hypothetical protein
MKPSPARTRPVAPAVLLVAALMAGCATEGTGRPPGAAADAAALSERAAVLGSHMRAAVACGQPVSATAQDRAAMIETAVLDLHQRLGGAEARDGFLTGLAPPAFDPRQRGRDKAAWCAAHREDVQRVSAWLDGPEGAAFARQAEATLR